MCQLIDYIKGDYMEFKIIKDEENPLLDRRQLIVEIGNIKVTPKRSEVLKQFSAKQGLEPKHVVVDTLYATAGCNTIKAYIKAYKNINALQRVEVKNNIVKWQKIMEELYPNEAFSKKSPEKTEEKKEEVPKPAKRGGTKKE